LVPQIKVWTEFIISTLSSKERSCESDIFSYRFFYLKVQSGWRIDYCAASFNYTNCPADFDEFYTQRRRWIGSTLANLYLLLKESSILRKLNHGISFWFLIYQTALLVSTILGPSTVMLIISGKLC